MDASQSLGRRQNAAHLDSTTIVEASCSLSLRGTSGERAGERGTFHRIGAANWNPLSLTLSPLLCRGERESTSGMVVVLGCAHHCTAALPLLARDEWGAGTGRGAVRTEIDHQISPLPDPLPTP